MISVPIELLPRSESSTVRSPYRRVSALVDTGATVSGIRRDLAESLELPVVDRTVVGLAHGTVETERVIAQIMRPATGLTGDGGIPDRGSSQGTFRTVTLLTVIEGDDDFLLGMDLLEGGRLVIDLPRGRWEWKLTTSPIEESLG